MSPGPEILITGCMDGFCVRVDGHVIAAELGLFTAGAMRRDLERLADDALEMLAETLSRGRFVDGPEIG